MVTKPALRKHMQRIPYFPTCATRTSPCATRTNPCGARNSPCATRTSCGAGILYVYIH